MDSKPLSGLRVIELGQLIAGPWCGTLLGYFGAEVIKVEPPGGDPIRGWRSLDDSGTSWWWYSVGRNKRSVTINLKEPRGRDLVRKLVDGADVLIENFRPGTMEGWGLGPEDFTGSNPGLVYTRISGYGQSGPLADKPGYASVTEAFSGFRSVNGFPGQPPVRPNLSAGDTVAGLHAAFGTLLALMQRGKLQGDGRGQVVDVALYEAMFNLMEAVVPEYDGAGEVRGPSGSTLTGIVPTNTYLCADERWVVIGGNGDSIFVRLMEAAGRADIAHDPACADNAGRVVHQQRIDDAISAWTATLPANEVIGILEAARVPVGPILDVTGMMDDPQYNARGMFETVEANGRPLKIPAIAPKLGRTPGGTEHGGAPVGVATAAVLAELGIDAATLEGLRLDGVV